MGTSEVHPVSRVRTPPGAGAICCRKFPPTLGGPITPIVVTACPSLSGIGSPGPCPASRFPLSSTALTRGCTVAGTALVKDQDVEGPPVLSVAPCQVAPSSKEISTAATLPPT